VQPRDGQLNLGVQGRNWSYGCVYFGGWDRSRTFRECPRLQDIYGDDLFLEGTARALKNDTFDLASYRENFSRFMSEGR
jgi:hypothetical protein